jgi:hemerythrin-like domain-containing protein
MVATGTGAQSAAMKDAATRPQRRPANPFVDAMEKEHRRVVDDLRSLRSAGTGSGCGEIAVRADRNLRAHFDVEEKILFPILLAVTGGGAGEAVALLVEEHEATRRLLDRLRSEIAEGAPSPATLDEILKGVASHRRREEGLLYPICTDLCGEPLENLQAALRAKGITP